MQGVITRYAYNSASHVNQDEKRQTVHSIHQLGTHQTVFHLQCMKFKPLYDLHTRPTKPNSRVLATGLCALYSDDAKNGCDFISISLTMFCRSWLAERYNSRVCHIHVFDRSKDYDCFKIHTILTGSVLLTKLKNSFLSLCCRRENDRLRNCKDDNYIKPAN